MFYTMHTYYLSITLYYHSILSDKSICFPPFFHGGDPRDPFGVFAALGVGAMMCVCILYRRSTQPFISKTHAVCAPPPTTIAAAAVINKTLWTGWRRVWLYYASFCPTFSFDVTDNDFCPVVAAEQVLYSLHMTPPPLNELTRGQFCRPPDICSVGIRNFVCISYGPNLVW